MQYAKFIYIDIAVLGSWDSAGRASRKAATVSIWPHSPLEHRASKHVLSSPQSSLGIGILKENWKTNLQQVDKVAG